MGRKRLFIIGGLVMGATLLFLLWPRGPEEPVYQGKRLTDWLRGVHSESSPETRAAAHEAVQALGTNAIPYLLFEFERVEPKWRKTLTRWKFLRETLSLRKERDFWRHREACQGLTMLGSNAAPALPTIVRYLGDRERGDLAAAVLYEAGTAGLPYLIDALSSTNAGIVARALMQIEDMMPETDSALPSIIKLLDHPMPSIRRQAIEALAGRSSRSDLLVPALRKALSDSEAEVRRKAVSGLTSFEAAAKSAVPDLLRLLKDPDPRVAAAAKYSLGKIDPSALPVREP